MTEALDDALLIACVELIGRTGATQFQIRFSDDEDPTIWMAAARYEGTWVAAGGMTPRQAAIALTEQLVDGGRCQHCQRPTVVDTDFTTDDYYRAGGLCAYLFDPERSTFRRSCEGR